MTERVSHSYLKTRELDDFYVIDRDQDGENRFKGRFFEGPIEGTVLREVPFAKMVYPSTSHEEVGEVVRDYVDGFRASLKQLDGYGIRTVHPRYVIGEREVPNKDGYFVSEKVLGILTDKIGGAMDFEDALSSDDPTYVKAYDDLAGRLVAFIDERFHKGEVIEPEVARVSQYVIDLAAERLSDMTVLADVDPHPRASLNALDSASSSLLSLSHEIVQMVKACNGTVEITSLPIVMEAIAKMPEIINLTDENIKDQLLEAMLNLDDKRIYDLSVEEPKDVEDDYED